MATRRGLSRQDTLRRVSSSSRLELFLDDLINTIEDTKNPDNIESYKCKNNDPSIKRITLLLSLYHDWNNTIPDQIHTKLSKYRNNTLLKNEFLSNIIKSNKKYREYHGAIFSFSELKCKTDKILSLLHDKHHSYDEICGIYDFITTRIDEYNQINLLNDYHHILSEYYDKSNKDSNKKFENMYNYIIERIGPCDISTCNYIKQLYGIQSRQRQQSSSTRTPKAGSGTPSPSFSPKEIVLIDILNQIHCLIFHSFDIHKLKQRELKSVNHHQNFENNLQITSQSMLKLREITKQKHEKLKPIFKSDYFKSYPKYIANHEFHGIQTVTYNNSSDDSLDDLKLSDEDITHNSTDIESTLDSLPSLKMHGEGRWSTMMSQQKMYKLNKLVKKTKNSIQNRSLTLLDGLSRTVTPRNAELKFSFSNDRPSSKSNNNDHKDKENKSDNDNFELQYLFGRKFSYWSYGKDSNDPYYVKPKEKSLKQEILNKKHINISEWNIYTEKAKVFLKCDNCKNLSGNRGFEDKYKIHYGDDIKLEHILSVLLYCNHHQLRYNFIRTFHPSSNNDDIQNSYDNKLFIKKWVKRHRKYATFTRFRSQSIFN